MRRDQFEHILRAAQGITGASDFVVVGSQAILGSFSDPPSELQESMELDLFTLRAPEDADLIDGSIGEGSPFHRTFGYYAHGVGLETAVLPRGWRDRLRAHRSPATAGATGHCLEPHDLAVSKLVAGRPKDLVYVSALLRHGLAAGETLRARIAELVDEAERTRCAARLERLLAGR